MITSIRAPYKLGRTINGIGPSSSAIWNLNDIQQFPNVSDNGLVLNLDAGNNLSYPGSGNIWYDLSPEGSDFTLYNGAYWDDSGESSCMVFDGIDDNAARSTPESLQLKNNLTIICYFSQSATAGDNFSALLRCGLTTDTLYSLFIGRGVRRNAIQIYANGNWNTLNPNNGYLVLGAFNAAACTLDGTVCRFYWNGQLISQITVPMAQAASAGIISIGASRSENFVGSATQDFGGKISIVQIYNRPLTQNEIKQNFNQLGTRYNVYRYGVI